MIISRLEEFELLLELKLEQKKGTSLVKLVLSHRKSGLLQSVCPSPWYILDIALGFTRTSPIARAWHTAKIRAKSLIVSKKKLFYSSRTYAVKWQFLAENETSGKLDRSDTQEQSMLFDST
jgi:hypothetical protein